MENEEMDQPSLIRLGLVEDQFLFRQGIKAILESWPYFKVVFECANGYSVRESLENCKAKPDVLLVDISLPSNGNVDFNGLDVTVELGRIHPEIKVIILSVHDDPYLMAQLIEKGACGYLVKDSDPEEVHNAIVSVHQTGSYINETTLKAIQDRLGGRVKAQRLNETLTRREEEVLKLVCQQLTAEEIADKLFISPKTVNGHKNNLLQKTGSKNMTGLVMYAVKHHIVEVI